MKPVAEGVADYQATEWTPVYKGFLSLAGGRDSITAVAAICFWDAYTSVIIPCVCAGYKRIRSSATVAIVSLIRWIFASKTVSVESVSPVDQPLRLLRRQGLRVRLLEDHVEEDCPGAPPARAVTRDRSRPHPVDYSPEGNSTLDLRLEHRKFPRHHGSSDDLIP